MRAISPSSTPRARSWLAIFAGSFGLILLILAGLIFALRDQLPPPKFSGNLSLNEKIRWARPLLQAGACDGLVLGSSIALNNVDTLSLAQGSGERIINLGVWGLEIQASYALLESVLRLCKPKIVFLPIYYGDFSATPDRTGAEMISIDAYLLDRSGHEFIHYIRHGDLFGLWRHYRVLKRYRAVGGTSYLNLAYDRGGSALLNCEGFARDPQRWNGFQKRAAVIDAKVQRDFESILRQLQILGVKTIIAETPMRGAARELLAEPLKDWRETLTKMAAERGALFLPPPSNFGDELFADYTHLNACGAQAWTRLIAQEAKLIP